MIPAVLNPTLVWHSPGFYISPDVSDIHFVASEY